LNSQKYKIQALIAEIDEVLSKPAPRLPWTGSMDTVHQRQLLERVRAYLVSSDSNLTAGSGPASPNVRPQPVPVPKVPQAAPRPSAAEQIMLAVTGEISHLRSSLTEPLQEDIEALRMEQQALIQEIKQLEAQRQQQQSLAQQQANQQQIISEFLQVLTARLQETLTSNFSQILSSLENQLLQQSSAAPYSLGSAQSEPSALEVTVNPQTSGEHPRMTPAQRLEQMQLFQSRVDNLLMSLDSRMGTVFEALQANLESYQASLGQGLENMHGLSQQSEAMFVALVNHLAAQLGREASSYVQQPIDLANLETVIPPGADGSDATSALSNTPIEQSVAETQSGELVRSNRTGEFGEQDRLPYADTEISPQLGQLRGDGDRLLSPISLPELADNLFTSAPEIPQPKTPFSGAESENMLAETGEDVEDLYASLFAGEAVAEVELEVETFPIENTGIEVKSEAVQDQAAAPQETTEALNKTEDLFVNLLDEGESLENILVGEDSEFVGNSVNDLTLDTADLFEPQVATVSQVSEPPASTASRQIDPDDRENLETAQNRGEPEDAAVPQSGSLPLKTPAEISRNLPTAEPRVPSYGDVQSGEFDPGWQRLDDAYIQASPDEDLLPLEALEDDLDRALNLDNNTLEQLEADLYNLEGLENTSSRRSISQAANSLDLSASSPEGGAKNPFAVAAEEELGTLEDLFADVLEVSFEDEPFVLEDELEDDLFAEEDESNLTLDEILASFNESDRPRTDSPPPETAETNELRSSPPKNKKKT